MLPLIPWIVGGIAAKLIYDAVTDDDDDDYDYDYHESERQRRERAEFEARVAKERELRRKVDEFKDRVDVFIAEHKEFEQIFANICQSIDDSMLFETGDIDKNLIDRSFMRFTHDPYSITLDRELCPKVWCAELMAFQAFTEIKLYRTDEVTGLIDVMEMCDEATEGIDEMLEMIAKKEKSLQQDIAQHLAEQNK